MAQSHAKVTSREKKSSHRKLGEILEVLIDHCQFSQTQPTWPRSILFLIFRLHI